MSHPAISILERYKARVWPEVEAHLTHTPFPEVFRIPDQYADEERTFWDIVSDYPTRKGKYLRPALVMLSGRAQGVPEEKLITIAAAMQLSEEWLLIHDDVEDHSLARRGKPALHQLWGPELAINAGDMLHTAMWHTLHDARKTLEADLLMRICDEFTTMLTRTMIGQHTEIRWTHTHKLDLTDDEYFFICDGKTSYYTIAHPLRLGALVAGASPEQLDALATYGKLLGRCFQVIDDILDVTGDFGGQKMHAGNDIYEGKRTLMLSHVYRTSTGANQERLSQIMNLPREEKTADDVQWVLAEMHERGSIAYARDIAQHHKAQAEEFFATHLTFLSEPPARDELAHIADFILNRTH